MITKKMPHFLVCFALLLSTVFYSTNSYSALIEDVLSHCASIREKKNPNLPLPEGFKKRFETLIKKAKTTCTEGVLIKKAPDVAIEQARCLKLVGQVEAEPPVSLADWNLNHYRLALLFEVMNNPEVIPPKVPKNTSLDPIFTQNVLTPDEREMILNRISSKSSMENFIVSEEYKKFTRFPTFESLQVSNDFEYCPVATSDSLSPQTMNKAFANHVFFTGVTFSQRPYDNMSGGPITFWNHDLVHNSDYQMLPLITRNGPPKNEQEMQARMLDIVKSKRMHPEVKDLLDNQLPLNRKRTLTQEEVNHYQKLRKERSEFVSFLDQFKGAYNQRTCETQDLHVVYFILMHEFVDTDLQKECSLSKEKRKLMSPHLIEQFSKVSHFNLILPKNLQADKTAFTKKYEEMVESRCVTPLGTLSSITKDLEAVDKISDKTKILAIQEYLEQSQGCLCEAWSSFRGGKPKLP